ncbi:uncharacterized protein [Miscanthus floridulus]|uniref:uncharacterized protein isoform X4 n=1 Tax=Miscanthus floridulus TaxID=154761 RepID=UPI0034585EFB
MPILKVPAATRTTPMPTASACDDAVPDAHGYGHCGTRDVPVHLPLPRLRLLIHRRVAGGAGAASSQVPVGYVLRAAGGVRAASRGHRRPAPARRVPAPFLLKRRGGWCSMEVVGVTCMALQPWPGNRSRYLRTCINENPGCLFITTNRDPTRLMTSAQEWSGLRGLTGSATTPE